MDRQKLAAVVLAAGKGTRMKSLSPKVVHKINGRPVVSYPVRLARQLGCRPTVMVVGHGAAEVEGCLAGEDVRFALQKEQLGTGHALLCAKEQLADFSGTLLLLCGDVPLLQEKTMSRLIEHHLASGASATVLTAEAIDPKGYGRIVREGDKVMAIVEERDATSHQKSICEINTGIYAFEAPLVFEALNSLERNNAQGEYYLTDILQTMRAAGRTVEALITPDMEEAMGINDRIQLAEAEKAIRRRVNEKLMLSGVTFVDRENAYIEEQVEIGTDTVIYPGVCLGGQTRIGSRCIIGPHVIIQDCVIGDEVHIKAGSVMEGSHIGDHSDVGPMAHLRPGTVLAGHNKIGNFVETKKAQFGEGSKASHLTYIGDAEVGSKVNIGCGTITCNYDGVNKHKTIIEDGVSSAAIPSSWPRYVSGATA